MSNTENKKEEHENCKLCKGCVWNFCDCEHAKPTEKEEWEIKFEKEIKHLINQAVWDYSGFINSAKTFIFRAEMMDVDNALVINNKTYNLRCKLKDFIRKQKEETRQATLLEVKEKIENMKVEIAKGILFVSEPSTAHDTLNKFKTLLDTLIKEK